MSPVTTSLSLPKLGRFVITFHPTCMRTIIESFTRHLSARHAPRTIRTYGAVAAAFLIFTGHSDARDCPDEPQRTHVEAFLSRPRQDGQPRAPATRNQELAALRGFARFAERNLGWSDNPTAGIPFDREPPRDPAVLGLGEVRTVFTVVAKMSPKGERAKNLAMFAVFVQLGLRVHELVGLNTDQVDAPSSTLVAICGKGSTVHDLPLGEGTLALLSAWMKERAQVAREGESALFVSASGTRASIRSVQRLVARIREAMGTAKHITPHTFRHTCATLALTLGTDLSTVSDLLRHSDLNTTRRYLHLVDERRREAVGKLEAALPPSVLPGRATEPCTSSECHPVTSPNSAVCSPAAGLLTLTDTVTSVRTKTSSEDKNDLDVQRDLGDAA